LRREVGQFHEDFTLDRALSSENRWPANRFRRGNLRPPCLLSTGLLSLV
jgi:hypothetical protein